MPIMSEMGQGTKGNSQCTKEEDVIKQEKPSPEAIVDGLKNPHQQSGVELQQAKEENEKEKMRKTVRTRICMISDTHTRVPLPENSSSAYRWPLPKADILLHAGDITMVGYIKEYEEMIDTLTKVEAELKIVIAGNHDITLDENFYEKTGKKRMHRNHAEDLSIVRELWTGDKAKQANIFYLEEGTRTFVLKNGARFTVSCTNYLALPSLRLFIGAYKLRLIAGRFIRPHGNQSFVIGHSIILVVSIDITKVRVL